MSSNAPIFINNRKQYVAPDFVKNNYIIIYYAK